MHAIINYPVFEADDYPASYIPDCDLTGGDSLCETSGYIPKEQQINALISSGSNLDYYNKQMYNWMQSDPYPFDGQDAPTDPTTAFDYDFFQLHDDVVFLRNQLEESERLQAMAAAGKGYEGSIHSSPDNITPASTVTQDPPPATTP